MVGSPAMVLETDHSIGAPIYTDDCLLEVCDAEELSENGCSSLETTQRILDHQHGRFVRRHGVLFSPILVGEDGIELRPISSES